MHQFLKLFLPALLAMNSSPINQQRNNGFDQGEVEEIQWEATNWDNQAWDNEISNGISKINSEIEDIAEDLQHQIDELRKKIKEILDKSAKTEDQDAVAELKKQMEDLRLQTQELYKKLDQLSSSLQQEFRQKLDKLATEMAEANKKLEDRIKDLEDLVQHLTISQCIGNLRDGMVETALGTFRHIKNPNLHVEQIVSDAYRSVSDCKNLNSFLSKIESEATLTTKRKNEIRARGYYSFYNHLKNDQFSTEGSDCAYPLAWNVNAIHNRLVDEITTNDYTTRVITNLPQSISKFTVENLVKLYSYAPYGNEVQTCYVNDKGSNYIITDQYWNTTQSKDGTWFMLFNQDERPLSTRIISGTVQSTFLSKDKYTTMTDDPNALWKPTAVSNSQFYLENKAGFRNAHHLAMNHKSGGAPGFVCYEFVFTQFSSKYVFFAGDEDEDEEM